MTSRALPCTLVWAGLMAAQPNELRIRVARSRDTILGWTKSGPRGCYWSFNERGRVVKKCGASNSVVGTCRRRWAACFE